MAIDEEINEYPECYEWRWWCLGGEVGCDRVWCFGLAHDGHWAWEDAQPRHIDEGHCSLRQMGCVGDGLELAHGGGHGLKLEPKPKVANEGPHFSLSQSLSWPMSISS